MMTFFSFVHYLLLDFLLFVSFVFPFVSNVYVGVSITRCVSNTFTKSIYYKWMHKLLFLHIVHSSIFDALHSTQTHINHLNLNILRHIFLLLTRSINSSYFAINYYKFITHSSRSHITAWLYTMNWNALPYNIYIFCFSCCWLVLVRLLRFWHFKTSSSILGIYRTINSFTHALTHHPFAKSSLIFFSSTNFFLPIWGECTHVTKILSSDFQF